MVNPDRGGTHGTFELYTKGCIIPKPLLMYKQWDMVSRSGRFTSRGWPTNAKRVLSPIHVLRMQLVFRIVRLWAHTLLLVFILFLYQSCGIVNGCRNPIYLINKLICGAKCLALFLILYNSS